MTKIEWTKRPGTKGESWNMIGGCSKVSDGCTNCYALSMSWRLQNMEKRPDRYEGVCERNEYEGSFVRVANEPVKWTGRVNLDYDALEIPYRWKKPRTVFVASMADLFHPQVPVSFILSVFRIMHDNPQHTFLVLTKRARRMMKIIKAHLHSEIQGPGTGWRLDWPFENVWLGVTAENQEWADRRIPELLRTPAAVRFVSVEPMLAPMNLAFDGRPGMGRPDCLQALSWVIVGCESGPNRRPMELEWALDLVRQCDTAGVPVFVKQLPVLRDRRFSDSGFEVSKDPSEWPVELQRREWPK